ncbi:MAG: LamG domain-containing protein [Planctomycetota bacterium]
MSRLALQSSLLCLAALSGASEARAQLIHRWSFDGTGTTAFDSVGGAHGALMGGATLTGTGALTFDGVDDYVALPSGIGSAYETQTFEIWFDWAGGGSNIRIIDFGDNNGTAGLTYLILTPRASNGNAAAYIQTTLGGGSKKVWANSPASSTGTTHLALVYDSPNDEMRIYFDGTYQSSVTLAENLSQLNDVNCWIGRSNWSTDPYYRGSVTELRVFNYDLSTAEIAASYAAGPDSIGTIGISYCQPAAANLTGFAATLGANGSASVANNDLVLQAAHVPQHSFAIFLTSRTQGFHLNPSGGPGYLCLAGGIGRYVGPGQIQNAGAAEQVSLAIDLTDHPTPNGLVSVMPGETWNFQLWYRDAVGGVATSNFSDALEVTFQ